MSPEKEKLAKLLRSTDFIVDQFVETMDAATERRGVVEVVVNDNQGRLIKALKEFGLNEDSRAEQVYQQLQDRISSTDNTLSQFLGRPNVATDEGCLAIVQAALDLVSPARGFFLKRDKAMELLNNNPPQHLLQLLGYESVDQAVKKEGLFAVYSSVRFAESAEWLNDVFFRQYEHLTVDDFEYRELEVIVLPDRWREIGQRFAGKKLHHVSHLKELGVIFVIPISKNSSEGGLPEFGEGYNVSGGSLEVFTLVLHYLFEVPFYADIFARYAQKNDFTKKIISALRGDVLGVLPPSAQSAQWRVIQRYLAKDNLSDPRLSEPHVNPEAIHWAKAERKLAELSVRHPEFGFSLWAGLDFVGGFFALEQDVGEEVLLSFDLIDNMISLRRRSSVISKYLYHQQEALWNKIFAMYIGDEKRMEDMIKDNLYRGYIEF